MRTKRRRNATNPSTSTSRGRSKRPSANPCAGVRKSIGPGRSSRRCSRVLQDIARDSRWSLRRTVAAGHADPVRGGGATFEKETARAFRPGPSRLRRRRQHVWLPLRRPSPPGAVTGASSAGGTWACSCRNHASAGDAHARLPTSRLPDESHYDFAFAVSSSGVPAAAGPADEPLPRADVSWWAREPAGPCCVRGGEPPPDKPGSVSGRSVSAESNTRIREWEGRGPLLRELRR